MPLQLYEKEKIFDACLSAFARHGYKKTTTEMLAKAAGISKSLIFHHFKTKKNLYFSILEYCFEKLAEELKIDSIKDYPDFFEAVDKFARLKLCYFQDHPDVYKLAYEAFYSTPPELKADIDEKYGPLIAENTKVLESLFEKVPIRKGIDRKEAFDLIMATSEHFENRFLSEVTDLEAIDIEYAQSLIDKMNRFFHLIRFGIEE